MKKVILTAFVAAAAFATSCSGGQGLVTKGSPSTLDTLSYSLGVNIGSTVNYQLADIPFDYAEIEKGLEASAFEKSPITAEEALQTLQTYFMEFRAQRAEIVNKRRNEADSIAIANGADSATVAEARAAMKADADMFESEGQRKAVSFAFGVDLGTNMKKAEIPIQTYWISQAMTDTRDDKLQLDEKAAMVFLQQYFTVVRPAELKAISEEKLAEIEKTSGVTKTESGLMYRIEVAGDSSVIATDDRDVVNVNYTGRLIRNNKVFDTSRFADRTDEMKEMLKAQDPETYNQDKPIEFPLNRVIPGWTEGMKLVGKGGRISLWIPSDLAYGTRGAGGDIGPNEALFFDVEIVDVIPFEAEAE